MNASPVPELPIREIPVMIKVPYLNIARLAHVEDLARRIPYKNGGLMKESTWNAASMTRIHTVGPITVDTHMCEDLDEDLFVTFSMQSAPKFDSTTGQVAQSHVWRFVGAYSLVAKTKYDEAQRERIVERPEGFDRPAKFGKPKTAEKD